MGSAILKIRDVASGIVGTAGVWTPITTDIDLSTTVAGQDAYGTVGTFEDPFRPNVVFTGTYRQGIFKSTDYGATFSKISTGSGIADIDSGIPWVFAFDPAGNWIVCNAGYSSRVGVYRSTDGGVSWSWTDLGDVNDVSCSPDGSILLTTPHGGIEHWFESNDGGGTWNSIGTTIAGIWNVGAFLNNTTWIGIGINGMWRGRKISGSWTFDSVMDLRGPHGGTQLIRDTVNGWMYISGSWQSDVGQRRIYRCALTDAGATADWHLVDATAGSYARGVMWKAGLHLYAASNVATHPFWDADIRVALASAGDSWSTYASPDPSWVNGPHHVAVVTDGTRIRSVGGFDNSGLWGLIES